MVKDIDVIKRIERENYNLFLNLDSPDNIDTLLRGVYKLINETDDDDLLPLLISLSNVGVTYNFIHYHTMYQMVINLYDKSIWKCNIHEKVKLRGAYSVLLDIINEMDNDEEIFELLDKCEFKTEQAFKYFSTTGIDSYVRVFACEKDAEESKNSLKEKLNRYKKSLSMREEKSIQNRKISEDMEYLYDAYLELVNFINSGACSVEEYSNISNISVQEFLHYMDLIKIYSTKDYDIYLEYTGANEEERYAFMVDFINSTVDGITNGVLDNGHVRPFDVIDYYMIGGKRFIGREKELISVARKIIPGKKGDLFKRFIVQYAKKKENNINEHISRVTYKQCIDGEIKELTNDGKDYIIEFLNNNNIVLNTVTFSVGIRRYMTNTLTNNRIKILDNKSMKKQ